MDVGKSDHATRLETALDGWAKIYPNDKNVPPKIIAIFVMARAALAVCDSLDAQTKSLNALHETFLKALEHA